MLSIISLATKRLALKKRTKSTFRSPKSEVEIAGNATKRCPEANISTFPSNTPTLKTRSSSTASRKNASFTHSRPQCVYSMRGYTGNEWPSFRENTPLTAFVEKVKCDPQNWFRNQYTTNDLLDGLEQAKDHLNPNELRTSLCFLNLSIPFVLDCRRTLADAIKDEFLSTYMLRVDLQKDVAERGLKFHPYEYGIWFPQALGLPKEGDCIQKLLNDGELHSYPKMNQLLTEIWHIQGHKSDENPYNKLDPLALANALEAFLKSEHVDEETSQLQKWIFRSM